MDKDRPPPGGHLSTAVQHWKFGNEGKENVFRRKNNDLQDTQVEQAEKLYEALKEVYAERHRGRNFSDVDNSAFLHSFCGLTIYLK